MNTISWECIRVMNVIDLTQLTYVIGYSAYEIMLTANEVALRLTLMGIILFTFPCTLGTLKWKTFCLTKRRDM